MEKNLIDKGIENIPNIFKYSVSKIKYPNVQRALNSDIADYVVEEAQDQTKNRLNNLFRGVEKKWAKESVILKFKTL